MNLSVIAGALINGIKPRLATTSPPPDTIPAAEATAKLIVELEKLPDGLRVTVISAITERFCPHCGCTMGRRCECWNDR